MKIEIYTLVIESFMKRIPGYHLDFGWGNGYILLPYNHPLYGIPYDDIDIYAHGGLTFSDKFSDTNFLEWIKGREIDGDVTKENFEKFFNYWMIGFDTNHLNDNLIDCSKYYVMSECESLIDQCLDDNIEGMKKYKTFYLRKDKLKYLKNLMP